MAKPVIFRFAADVKNLKAGLSEAERDMQQFGRSLQRVGAGLTAGVTAPIAALGVASINAASDLDEALNVTRLTFGEAAETVEAFGDTASQALGQSKRAALQAATTFGGLFRGVGQSEQAAADYSLTLTRLASDLGSAFNTEPEDAVLALGAALRGESEPIRRYNILLDDAAVRQRAVEMGLAATTSEVDNQDKVLARYNLIMEQSTLVQGDFANTSDGLANTQRRLSAEWENARAVLGESLLPLAEQLVGTATDLLSAFTSLPPAARDTVLGIGALAAAIGPALVVTGTLIRNFNELREAAPRLAGVLGRGVGLAASLYVVTEAAEAAGLALRGVVTGGVGSLGAAGADLQRFAKTGEAAGDVLDVLGADLEKFDGAVRRLGQKSVVQNLQDALTLGFDPGSIHDARVLMEELDAALTELSSKDAGAAADAFDRLALSAAQSGVDLETLLDLMPLYAGVMDDAAVQTNAGADATEEFGDEQRSAAREVKSLTDRLKEQADRQREAVNPALAAIRSVSKYEEALAKVNEVQADTKATAEDLEDANLDLLETILDMQSATILAEGDMDGFRGVLRDLQSQGLLSAEQVERLSRALNGLPEHKNVTVSVTSTGKVFDTPLHNPLTPDATEALKGFSAPRPQGSRTTNVTINNPVGHTAEDDLITTTRALEFLT